MGIKEEDVVVGREYTYPHPSGFGLTWTVVVEILPPTKVNPRRRVRHESRGTGHGAVDDMEVFTTHARPSER